MSGSGRTARMCVEERSGAREGPILRALFTRVGPFASRCIAGETILVPLRGDVARLESIFTLSPVAAFIWHSLSKPSDEDTLVSLVVAEFEVDEATARVDVHEFLETMREEGLVTCAEERA